MCITIFLQTDRKTNRDSKNYMCMLLIYQCKGIKMISGEKRMNCVAMSIIIPWTEEISRAVYLHQEFSSQVHYDTNCVSETSPFLPHQSNYSFLTLYHTIPRFKEPEENSKKQFRKKKKKKNQKVVSSIFSFFHMFSILSKANPIIWAMFTLPSLNAFRKNNSKILL